ncbi:MAG: sulfotransferase domain-containing protein [Pirellulales bacterium]|nr:sulfotransferase domain-containing protein [Pirellulales bacterium]
MITFPLQHRIRNSLRNSFVRDVVVAYRHRGVQPNDVMLATYPKSGTTWLAFMLAQLLWRAGREQKLLDNRFLPIIGKQRYAQRRLPSGGRIIRTHERYRPRYAKSIYVVRDGRDVAVSMYWHMQRATGMQADFSDYLVPYLQGRLSGAGAWHKHVTEWLDCPAYREGRVLLVRYESMKEDAERELRRTAEFLGVTPTNEQIADALEAGSMESMKRQEKASEGIAHLEAGEKIPVVRKGIVGDWQNYFSPADVATFAAFASEAMSRLGYSMSGVPATSPIHR